MAQLLCFRDYLVSQINRVSYLFNALYDDRRLIVISFLSFFSPFSLSLFFSFFYNIQSRDQIAGSQKLFRDKIL